MRSEWRGLYEFLVKDTGGGDRKGLHNSALNPPGGGGKGIIILPKTLGSERIISIREKCLCDKLNRIRELDDKAAIQPGMGKLP